MPHHIITSYQVYILSTLYIDFDVDLDHVADVVSVRFLHCKVILFPPFYIVLWKEITIRSYISFLSYTYALI